MNKTIGTILKFTFVGIGSFLFFGLMWTLIQIKTVKQTGPCVTNECQLGKLNAQSQDFN